MQFSARALVLSLALSSAVFPSSGLAEGRVTGSLGPPVMTARGSFKLVTYNVAGLPEGVSESRPSQNMGPIGALLNRYDLALVQEDFAYAAELRQNLRHPHVTAPFVRGERNDFGDGLSQFARLPFSSVLREAWRSCHGIIDSFFDCLTPKGFTFARIALNEYSSVDVYNLHMDAGGSAGDARARKNQLNQLERAILRLSLGQAVIVAGDTNVRAGDPAFADFLSRLSLTDTCAKLGCPDPARIDRVLYRSSPLVRLLPRHWRIDRSFVDARGRQLSDHLPVAVDFDWRSSGQLPVSASGGEATEPSRPLARNQAAPRPPDRR